MCLYLGFLISAVPTKCSCGSIKLSFLLLSFRSAEEKDALLNFFEEITNKQ